ncbi:protein YceG like [Nitrincola lacisaponensis]|uniref:Endolytic murein transglycosylase n=1 Tax=Nitrincola lacisaponensis TaxID=267850 RepID=A0A063Y153_9GAMM|nr:endolytic transglycosylase MltG [Nitrincola lacisaponensis]KDE40033.1 protein YceG like [Nitrincola lacisaponensis]
MLKKIVLLFLLTLVLAAAAAWYLFTDMERQLHEPLPLEETAVILVAPGTSFQQLMRRFERDGWLKQADFMRLYSRLYPEITAIRAGEYGIAPGSSLMDVVQQMNRGEVIAHRFTLIEGHTFRQVLAALHADDRIQPTLKDKTEAEIMALIAGDADQPAEGMFLAETYQFNRGASDVDLLRRAHQDLQAFLEAQWQARDESLPYKSAYEALIMASIIERETGVPDERSRIAGVFVRRLNIGMRLQTDPTVIYGMGERYTGRITRADLQRPTPWNTYTIDGLPPTPIAMVGREAIVAAFSPLEGDELYFVARGDGTHHFSRTLREHNNAVNRYQRNRRSDYRSSPAPGNGS